MNPHPTRTRRLPSPALVVATLALVLAVGGSAYAVTLAPANSVVSSSIADGQVRSRDLLNGGIKDKDVAEDALSERVLGVDSVGPEELGAIETFTATSAPTQDADGTTNGGTFTVVKVTATCPVEYQLIGGGARWVQPSNNGAADSAVFIQEQYSSNLGTSWTVEGVVDFGASGNIRLQSEAYCLRDTTFAAN